MSVRFDKQRLSDMSSYQKDPILKYFLFQLTSNSNKNVFIFPKESNEKKYNSMSNLEHKLR